MPCARGTGQASGVGGHLERAGGAAGPGGPRVAGRGRHQDPPCVASPLRLLCVLGGQRRNRWRRLSWAMLQGRWLHRRAGHSRWRGPCGRAPRWPGGARMRGWRTRHPLIVPRHTRPCRASTRRGRIAAAPHRLPQCHWRSRWSRAARSCCGIRPSRNAMVASTVGARLRRRQPLRRSRPVLRGRRFGADRIGGAFNAEDQGHRHRRRDGRR